ncbi:MAG: FkbM family methyltransferase [Chlorobium sp.]|uniref:FkbM family methyltransferase n=1 Tax=Chlorobium sp. TaxID=1095 RepID=UPI0025C58922|nr:FkbM family methyltransferase [Chlorobium sp.]MCF8382078.1 FkbM family methyltransferase [Chlorobium sp.]
MKSFKSFYRQVEGRVVTFIRQMIGQEPRNSVEVHCSKERIGNWVICPIGISSSSRILSLGVGKDTGFDRELIEKYACKIHAFDPTPLTLDWIRTQEFPPEFKFHPFAIGNRDSVMMFYHRIIKGKRSETMMTMVNEGSGESTGIEVGVKRMTTILRELGFDGIDILKMDIEGAEYDVIQDILDSGITVYQLVVEFHHRFRTLSVDMTISILQKLHAAGFRIFHISEKCKEYSFIHESTLKQYLATGSNIVQA